MRHTVRLPLAAPLAGCAGAGPTFSPQEVMAISTTKRDTEQLARQHRITWTEATRRQIAKAVRRAKGYLPAASAEG